MADILVSKSQINGNPKIIINKSYAIRHLICCMLSKTKPPIFSIDSDDVSHASKATDVIGKVLRKKEKPLTTEIDCGENATLLRLLLPIQCALGIPTTFNMSPSLKDRPHMPLIDELNRMGGDVCIKNNCVITKGKLSAGDYTICGNISSQYISGLLLALPLLDGDSKLYVKSPFYSRGYANMTICEMQRFGVKVKRVRNTFHIKKSVYKYSKTFFENDYSNNAFFIALGLTSGSVKISNLHSMSLQPDRRFLDILEELNATYYFTKNASTSPLLLSDIDLTVEKSQLKPISIVMSDCPDLILPLSAVLATIEGESVISGVRRLIYKESNRLNALIETLKNLGIKTFLEKDRIHIFGKNQIEGGVTLSSYNDHRMVMTIAVLAQKCLKPLRITNYECINKSFRTFFEEFVRLGGMVEIIN